MRKQKISLVFALLFIFSLPLFSETAVSYYQKAKEAFEIREAYEEAIDSLRLALEKNPKYLEALKLLSEVYFESGNYEYAYTNINKALIYAPNRSDLVLFSADIETKLKMYDLAQAKYEKIIKEDPLNMTAFNGLANLYLETDRKIQAKNTLLEILKADSDNCKALLKLASYYEKEDKAKAYECYKKNIQYNSLEDKVYYAYSLFLFNEGKLRDAVEQIKTAIEIKERESYFTMLGKYYLYLNQPDKAVEAFSKLSTEKSLNFYYLSHAYSMTGEDKKAVSSLMKCLGMTEEDEFASIFLDNTLQEFFPVSNNWRKQRSGYYYQTAMENKKTAFYDKYLYSLRRAIMLNPYNIDARLELVEYYSCNNFPERSLRELILAGDFSASKEIKDRITMESRNASFRLGKEWKINQYNVENEVCLIPLFVNQDISNPHYKAEQMYAFYLKELSSDKYIYEIVPYTDKNYSAAEKMEITKKIPNFMPYFVDLTVSEEDISVGATLALKNAMNGETIKELRTYQTGNDRVISTASSLLAQLDSVIPFRAKLLKISDDKAIINAGRRSGVKLKDSYYIIKNQKYPLQMGTVKYLVDKNSIKGNAIVVKVDENIAEIKFKDNDFFRDIDVGDFVILH
ncbi:MAG: hypothetical protein UHW86_01805 [Spirochaetota bacterium]|nr:hypothetical protein [Spirochaetota bacterium]